MKYFHVIYNSSEKGIDGGRGFCFRTYTQDTPSAYLNALQENELLGYAQGNCESVMPQTLKSDPESIQSYPSSYFFRELVAEGGKHIYALGRTIPVGFDYTFYMKYIPGRMGNYVVDCYLFEELPTPDVFQILYENPAQGSNRFVPEDPSPKESNEEMKQLSLGSQDALPVEEKPFKAASLPAVSPLAVNALFSLVEAKKSGKVLAVRTAWKKAAALMADLYRLLPETSIGAFSFLSNYQDEGMPKHTPIVLVNEFYDHSLSANLAVTYDTDKEWTPTHEYQLFGEAFEQELKGGDWQAVHDRVAWLLGDAYLGVMAKSKETNIAFYQYCATPKIFTLNALKDNEELLAVLADHIAKDAKFQQPLFSLVDEKVASASNEREVALSVNFLEWFRKNRIDVSAIVAKHKTHFTEKISASVSTFIASLTQVDGGLATWQNYLDRNLLHSKSAFLDDPQLKSQWKMLYRLFYREEELQGAQRAKVVARMVDCGLEMDTMLGILSDLYAKDKALAVVALKDMIKAHPDKVEAYESLLTHYLNEAEMKGASSDFLDYFKEQLSNERFASLFYTQLRLNGADRPYHEALPALKKLAETNPALKRKLEQGFSSEKNLFPALLSDWKAAVKRDEAQAKGQTDIVKVNLLDLYAEPATKDWRSLYLLLCGDEKEVTEQNCADLCQLAIDLKAKSSLTRLLDRFVPLVKAGQVPSLVNALGELLGMSLDDMLALVAKQKGLSTSASFLKEILRKNNVDVKAAVQLVAEKKMDVGDEDASDRFFEDCYGDQYGSYKRKQKIVGFAKKLFHRD